MSEGTDEQSPAIPSGRWPSTWPALLRPVRDRVVFVGATVLLTLAGTALLGDLDLSWWVPLLPLLLLIGPATRPFRVRRRFERAAERNELIVQQRGPSWRLQPAEGRGGVVALVSEDGVLSYVDARAGRR